MKLENRGRLQYFFHAPSSILPIRDALNEQREGYKTEPHIEVGAENLWKACFQSNNIIPHINSPEKYLFLMTTCRYPGFDVTGVKSIVGYIEKQGTGVNVVDNNELHYVYGQTNLFSFEHAIPLIDMNYNPWSRVKLVNEEDTAKILGRFNRLDNIVGECIDEIIKLDKEGITCPAIRGYDCPFEETCPRYGRH
ncbi:MAG: hypothetical protein AABW92_05290 [Nanoarchaeota archaeon]